MYLLHRLIPLMLVLTACKGRSGEGDSGTNPARNEPNDAPIATNSAAVRARDVANPIEIARLGFCRPSEEVTTTASRLRELADANGDGMISRSEAESAMNFVIGGMFFRADRNSDGKVTPEEGREVRNEIARQHPALASLLAQARNATGEKPFRALVRVLDEKFGATLTIDEARTAVKESLDDLFRLADANRDGNITPDEAINSSWDAARTLGSAAFASVDANNDKYISSDEFKQAMARTASSVFPIADTNKDGKLSEAEAATAMDSLIRRLGIPEVPSG